MRNTKDFTIAKQPPFEFFFQEPREDDEIAAPWDAV